MAASTFWSPQNGIRGWAMKGLADGEYEVTAQRSSFSNDSTGAAALPRRVTVRGADVTGLELTLTPLAAISGKVLLESASVDPARKGCDNRRAIFLEETILNLQRDEAANEPALPMGMSSYSTPDSRGEFSLRNLKADRYWFEVQLPHENVYLRAITLAEGTAKPVASNVARDGITLKSGERLTGLTIILAEGAAGVKGKVIAAEGATLPSQLRVYLVPAEKEAADEVLRYAETGAGGDGAFTFSHLAPGRYWMLAHAMPPNKSANNSKPVALNDAERVKLRKEAAAAQVTVELQSCQRVVDYGLKYNSR